MFDLLSKKLPQILFGREVIYISLVFWLISSMATKHTPELRRIHLVAVQIKLMYPLTSKHTLFFNSVVFASFSSFSPSLLLGLDHPLRCESVAFYTQKWSETKRVFFMSMRHRQALNHKRSVSICGLALS